MTPKVVFFDLDGTLYDSKGLKKRVALAALPSVKRLRLLIAERKSRKALSRLDTGTLDYEDLFAEMSSRSGFPISCVRDWYNGWYMDAIAEVLRRCCHPREGIVTRIESLRKEGIKVAVLSDYGNIENKLKALGMDPGLFDALFDAPSLGGFKPASCVFRTACQLLGCLPEEALMVGDREDTDGGCVKVGMNFADIHTYLL